MIKKYIQAIYFSLCAMSLLCSGSAFAQARASTAVKTPEAPAAEEVAAKPFWTGGSLMIDKKSLEYINAAIKSHDTKIPLETLLPLLFPSVQQAAEATKPQEPININEIAAPVAATIVPPSTAPAFYLNSILYFAHDNWSVWVNSKKISNKLDTSKDEISVMDITRSRAILLWRNSKIDLIYPGWRDDFISLGEGKYASPEKNIVVDAFNDSISFILKLNQSFVSKDMTIVEGEVQASPLSAATSAAGVNTITETLLPDAPLNNTPGLPDATISPSPAPKEKVDLSGDMTNIDKLKGILNQNAETLRNLNGDITQ
jgi:hypothetical protein